jgi:hypothetical protein
MKCAPYLEYIMTMPEGKQAESMLYIKKPLGSF